MNNDQSNLSTAVRGSNFIAPLVFCVAIFAGLFASCKKNPVGPNGKDSCDTCKTDTTHHPPGPNDSTSHNFVWTQYSLPTEGTLTGCWVFGPNDIYVVGGGVWKWNGTKWSNVSPYGPGGSLNGSLSGFSLFAFSESDYWLTDAGVAYHVDGTSAYGQVQDSAHPAWTHSSWGTSSTDMYSVGDGGTILHFDGTQWTKMNSGTTKDLHSIWGTSDQNIWAAGYNDSKGTVAIVHFDGSQWRVIDNSILPGQVGGSGGDGVNAAWTCDSGGFHHAYVAGAFFYHSIGGGTWVRDSGAVPNALSGGGFAALDFISGNSANDLWVAGAGGFLSHWNGRSWMWYKQFFNFSGASHDTYGLSIHDDMVCMVGENNGGGWVVIGQR